MKAHKKRFNAAANLSIFIDFFYFGFLFALTFISPMQMPIVSEVRLGSAAWPGDHFSVR